MDYRPKPLSRQGFTLIEILVVIGIIGVLIALAVTSFKAVENSVSQRRTKAMLANAQSMLAEYDAATGMRTQPGRMWTSPAFPTPPAKYTTVGFDIWRDTDPATVGFQPAAAPTGSLEFDVNDAMSPTSPRYYSAAVLNTAEVMRDLARLPGVKKIITQLPANSTLTIHESPPPPTATNVIHDVLLDAWDNPIIFVPASGLTTTLDPTSPASFVITSAQSYPAATPPAPVVAGGVVAGARPFFASAGPDGRFDKGDDNIYSFEK